jgi:predicted enzyme related to lactoylglutathione lyase
LIDTAGDGMPRVAYFEITAEKPEQAVKFYEKVFCWKIVKWKGPIDHWLITTGGEDEPGIDGGLGRRTESFPNQVNYIVVSCIDEFIDKVKQNGGTIVTPKQAIPTVGYYAFFKDPENNTLGLMEYDESAQ